MSTIALGIIFRNVAENIWGKDDLKFPSPLPESPMQFLGVNVLPMEILVVVGAVLMMLAVEFFNRAHDLRQGGGGDVQRPRRRRPDGHQYRPRHHVLLRASAR